MKSDRLKSILAIIAYAIIFIGSEVFGLLFKGWITNLLALIYPSLVFWIALVLTVVIERKNLINRDVFVQTCILSILFLWAASFVLSAMHSPVTAFMLEGNIPLRWQIFRLPSIALFKTGWFLILVIILLWYRHRAEKTRSDVNEKLDDTTERHQ
jgi:hypothetical protein